MKNPSITDSPLSPFGGRKFTGGVALGLLTLLVDRFTADGLNPQVMWALVALYGLFVIADAIITAAHAPLTTAEPPTEPPAPPPPQRTTELRTPASDALASLQSARSQTGTVQ